MPALNYKKEFAPKVESGKKQQTIGNREWHTSYYNKIMERINGSI